MLTRKTLLTKYVGFDQISFFVHWALFFECFAKHFKAVLLIVSCLFLPFSAKAGFDFGKEFLTWANAITVIGTLKYLCTFSLLYASINTFDVYTLGPSLNVITGITFRSCSKVTRSTYVRRISVWKCFRA